MRSFLLRAVFAAFGLWLASRVVPGITIDGTDAEAIAAAFTWAADRARAGEGPALIEVVAMRMCGHAHHDDMLYLGKEPPPGWDYPKLADGHRRGAGSAEGRPASE